MLRAYAVLPSGPAAEPAGNDRMALMTSLSVTDTALNVDGSGTTERSTKAGGCRWRTAVKSCSHGNSDKQYLTSNSAGSNPNEITLRTTNNNRNIHLWARPHFG